MSKTLVIRPYQSSDLKELVILCNSALATYTGTPAIRQADLEHDFHTSELGEVGVLVAEYGRQIIGYTQLILRDDPVNFLLPVLAPSADNKVASALFGRLKRLAAEAGWTYLQTGLPERDLEGMRLCELLELQLEHSLRSLMSIVQPEPFLFDTAMHHPNLPEDLDSLADLINRIFVDDWGFQIQTADTLANYFKLSGITPDQVFVVEPSKHRWIGIMVLRQDPKLARQGTGSIELLGVIEEERQKGWGKKLLQRANAYFSRDGLRRMETSVDAENRSALSFYLLHGFTPISLIHYYRCELI